MRILVADPSKQIAELLITLFHGNEVIHVATGPEALAAVEAGGIDLIITELWLPLVDGYQVIAQAGRIPVIVLTASTVSSVPGAHALITKPFSPCELMRVLTEA